MISRRTSAGERRGFTLVELLVVILIIAILMGLLLVALKGVRQRASESNCLQNLHQIGVAMRAYTDRYKGMMPAAEAWGLGGSDGTVIAGLAGSGTAANLRPVNTIISNDQSLTIFECPSDKGIVGRNEASAFIATGSSYVYVSRGGGWPSLGYAFTAAVGDTPAELGPDIRGVGSDAVKMQWTGIASFPAPGKKLVVMEPTLYLATAASGMWDVAKDQNQRHNIRNQVNAAGNVHQQGAALFLDWSARYLVRDKLAGQWTPPTYPTGFQSVPHEAHDWY